MDPNETLRQLRDHAGQILREASYVDMDLDALALAEYFNELDQWLTRGGYLPSDWNGKDSES